MDLAWQEATEGGPIVTDKLDQRIQGAFDRAHMPAGLAERTLARIEAERQAHTAIEPADGSSPVAANRLVVVDGSAPHRAARRRHRAPLVAALAACLALVALGIGGVAWASQPYAYVAIDVNPSIELGINRFDRVASTRAYNDDGAQVLEAADVQGETYEQAMISIEQALQGYLGDTSAIEITIVCDDRQAAGNLEDVGVRCLGASGTGQVHCSHASEEERHAAASAGIGIGKYRVWEQLAGAGVDISVDEAADMTMRELLDLAESEDVDASSAAAGSANEASQHAEEHHGQQQRTQDGTGNGKRHHTESR